VSLAQNKSSTMLSSNLQSIDLPVGCMQGRIKGAQRGQLPRALCSKGASRDDFSLF